MVRRERLGMVSPSCFFAAVTRLSALCNILSLEQTAWESTLLLHSANVACKNTILSSPRSCCNLGVVVGDTRSHRHAVRPHIQAGKRENKNKKTQVVKVHVLLYLETR